MTARFKLLSSILFSLAFLIFLTDKVFASEGYVELRSTTKEPYRCWASSIRMQNLEYKIPFTCKYLIYPADENVFNYVVWITSKSDGKIQRLGTLGLGRGEFKTKTPFTNMFVTTESKKDTKSPGTNTVMRGEVKQIAFLEEEVSPTPTPEEEEGVKEEGAEEEKAQEVAQLSTREKLVLALKRAGVAALLALVAIVGLIFVVTRSRG